MKHSSTKGECENCNHCVFDNSWGDEDEVLSCSIWEHGCDFELKTEGKNKENGTGNQNRR